MERRVRGVGAPAGDSSWRDEVLLGAGEGPAGLWGGGWLGVLTQRSTATTAGAQTFIGLVVAAVRLRVCSVLELALAASWCGVLGEEGAERADKVA
jgi:hypothetical protein